MRPPAYLSALAALVIIVPLACHSGQSDQDAQKTANGVLTPAPWQDPSSHTIQFVTMPDGTRIEVVDWGGQGEPLVFIAGLEDAAHMFDDFAPRLTNAFHVIGVTRRGWGASSHPDTGYSIATLSSDVHAVLDSLHLARVDLAGHSIAGQELTWVATHYPKQVDKLVYLDAGFDYAAHHIANGFPNPPAPTATDSASAAAGLAYARRVSGVPYPEAAFRATERFDSAGRDLGPASPPTFAAKVVQAAESTPPALGQVHQPVLAIYDRDTSSASVFPWMSPSDTLGVRWLHTLQDWRKAQEREFRARVPQATIVELRGAGHYVFLTQPDTVEHLMRRFLTATKQ
jgi:pimeloyl-ACP methyl ester carboxylesterase